MSGASIADVSDADLQQKLNQWVQEKALMKDLQSYFRHRMALMLQGSFIPFNMSRDSQTTQAVNWLIAEHLVHYNYHFTLSVMKSEAPIHDNLPKISAAKSEGVRQVLSVVPSAISNVCNILGLNPRGIMSEYQRGRASLLECLLESLSHAAETKTSMIGNSIQEQENFLQRLRSVDEHYEKLKRDVSPGKKEAIQMESLMEVDSEKEKKDAMAARVIETQEELELLKQELQALKAIFSNTRESEPGISYPLQSREESLSVQELKAAVSEVAAEMLSARCLLTELKSFIVQGPQRQAEMQQEAQVIAYNPIHGISGAGSTRDQKEDSSDKLSVPGLMKSPTGNGQNQHLEGKLLQLEDKLSSTLKELEYLRQEHQGLKSLNHALQKQMKVQQRPGPSFSESRIPLVEEQDEVIEDEDSSWSSGTKEFLQGSRERLKALEREAEMLMKRYQSYTKRRTSNYHPFHPHSVMSWSTPYLSSEGFHQIFEEKRSDSSQPPDSLKGSMKVVPPPPEDGGAMQKQHTTEVPEKQSMTPVVIPSDSRTSGAQSPPLIRSLYAQINLDDQWNKT